MTKYRMRFFSLSLSIIFSLLLSMLFFNFYIDKCIRMNYTAM